MYGIKSAKETRFAFAADDFARLSTGSKGMMLLGPKVVLRPACQKQEGER